MECTQEMQIKHAEAIATLQNQMITMANTLQDLSTIKETLTELKIISKQSIDFNQTQLRSNREVETILSKINENLNQLNRRVKTIEEKDIQDDISEADRKSKEEESNSEKFKAKFTFYGVIAAGVLALLGIIIPLIIR